MDMKNQIASIMQEVKPTKNLENVKDIVEGGYIDSFELKSVDYYFVYVFRGIGDNLYCLNE